MAASRISALVAIAGAAITATSVVPITSDFATPTTYKMTMAQLRSALFAGVSGYAASDILSIGAAAPAAGIVRLDGGTQAGASSVPIISAVQTWNNATTVFTGWLLNVTSTLSAATSKLIDLQLAGVSQFSVTKAGALTVAGTSSLQAVTAIQITATGAIQTANDAAGFVVNNTATTAVLLLGTTKAWVGAGSVTDARIGAYANLSLSAGGSNSAHLTIASSGAVTIAAGFTVSNGNVNVGTLPTSAGATGTLYSVAGVVHVS
jgi:hypothetical protein